MVLFSESLLLVNAQSYAKFVNPMVGTAAHGHTFPGPCLPFGMVQLSPDTRLEGWDGCSGYHFSDTLLYGFSHTHLSGTGVSDYGDILLMPGSGPAHLSPDSAARFPFASLMSKNTEQASAGYYAVTLKKHGIRAELTATLRTGLHRYTFSRPRGNYLFIDLRHRDKLLASGFTKFLKDELAGFRISSAWAERQHVYFYARFSSPVSHYLFNSDSTQCLIYFGKLKNNQLVVQLAISPVDIQGARNNLVAEFKHFQFDQARQEAWQHWEAALSRIKITDSNEQRKRVFYTALYHTLIHPSLAQDADGRYRGMDHRTYTNDPSKVRYTVFSLWDTYRAAHPLYQLVYPDYNHQFVLTFLQHAAEVQRLPVWELSSCETYCMIGMHSIAVLANAYLHGNTSLKNADTRLAVQTALARSQHSGLHYMAGGFIAANQNAESVSKTIENSLDYYAAGILGVEMDASKLAKSYQNLYNPNTGFFQAKANHAFVPRFDPREVNQHYTEANAYQYLFGAHHDIEGMVRCFAADLFPHPDYPCLSRSVLEARLDELFQQAPVLTGRQQADITGLIGQYAHGNEPSHHIAYLYNYAGRPHKTQELVRKICDEFYLDLPEGLVGNEDCGQMSAWYVFSSMGFYPTNPLSNYFDLGLPLFDKVEICVPDKKPIIITADKTRGDLYLSKLPSPGHYRLHLRYGDSLHFALSDQPAYYDDHERCLFFSDALHENKDFKALPFLNYSASVFDDTVHVGIQSLNPSDRFVYRLLEKNSDAVPQNWKPYASPVVLDRTALFQFGTLDTTTGRPLHILEAQFEKRNAPVVLRSATPCANHYHGGGDDALIDHRKGSSDFRDGFWQGWWGRDVELVFETKPDRQVRSLRLRCLQDQRSWIFLPRSIQIWGGDQRTDLVLIGSIPVHHAQQPGEVDIFQYESTWPKPYRFIKIVVQNSGSLPAWHISAGHDSWIFMDEIEFE